MTYTDTYPRQRSSSGGVFVFIGLIALATIVVATINIRPGSHAMDQHPDTAPLSGTALSFLEFFLRKFESIIHHSLTIKG